VEGGLQTSSITPQALDVTFEISDAAAVKNQMLLAKHHNDMDYFFQSNTNIFLGCGQEFHPVQVLERLLVHHHRCPKLKDILTEGSPWPLSNIEDSAHHAKNTELMQRGNHKSATTYADHLDKILSKEVAQVWMIPIPVHHMHNIVNAEIAPMGIARQWQADENGIHVFIHHQIVLCIF
jgi:hypothetical protein